MLTTQNDLFSVNDASEYFVLAITRTLRRNIASDGVASAIKFTAEVIVEMISRGSLDIDEGRQALKECYVAARDLIPNPIDLVKLLKAAFSTIKKDQKLKAQSAKVAIVKMFKKAGRGVAGCHRLYHFKGIEQGLLFGTPTQMLDNCEKWGWQKIRGDWYVKPDLFAVLGQVAVGM